MAGASRSFSGRFRLACSLVLLYAKLPGRLQYAAQSLFVGFRKTDVGHTHASPPAVDGQEQVRSFRDELRLLLWCE